MAKYLFKMGNSLTDEQRKELIGKLRLLMDKYEKILRSASRKDYFEGKLDAYNDIYKLINAEGDDYALKD